MFRYLCGWLTGCMPGSYNVESQDELLQIRRRRPPSRLVRHPEKKTLQVRSFHMLATLPIF